MVIEIPKDASETKIKSILQKTIKKSASKKTLDTFFGNLPKIEDGLKFQKRVRNEWK